MVGKFLFIVFCFDFIQCKTNDDTELPVRDMYSQLYPKEEDNGVLFLLQSKKNYMQLKMLATNILLNMSIALGNVLVIVIAPLNLRQKKF